nr:type II toxin-antitoxin system RelE/ParE family toxin [Luteimonas sp. Y-2-2-4F]
MAERVDKIIAAIAVLERNPLIGRPSRNDKRKLVIGRGPQQDDVALYPDVDSIETVFVQAISALRKAAFWR